jgi:hypothetical protein
MMKLENEDQQSKYHWDLYFVSRQNTFCLVVALEDEYLYPKRELTVLPSHLWVTIVEERDTIFLEVRLVKSHHFCADMKVNVKEEYVKPFTFAVISDHLAQTFHFNTKEQIFRKGLITKDAIESSFKVKDLYELRFSFETNLW